MNFRQLIWRNVRRNERIYSSYFLSSVFSVLVFFIFALLYFHPQLNSALPSNSQTISELAKLGLIASQVVIIVLSLIFLWYSFWNFLKARKRDLAVYLMLGMAPKDLRRLLMGENLIIGIAASLSGVGLGLIFSKLLLLIVQNIMHLHKGLAFYFPLRAIFLTTAVFLCLFFLLSIMMTVRIETDNLTSLSKTDEKGLPLPKTSALLSISGIVLLSLGYLCLADFVGTINGSHIPFIKQLFANLNLDTAAIISLIGCVIFTISATFLLLRQASISILKLLKKKTINQGGTRLLYLSELIFQMRENAVMYGLISLTATVAFVGIGLTSLLAVYNQSTSTAPTFSYVLNPMTDKPDVAYQQDLQKKITKKIEAAGYQPLALSLAYVGVTFNWENLQNTDDGQLYWQNQVYLLRASEYNQLAKFNGLQLISPKATAIYYFANGSSEKKLLSEIPAVKRTATAQIKLAGESVTLTLHKIPQFFNVNLFSVAVVADDFYEKMTQLKDEKTGAMPVTGKTTIIDFKEWQKNADLTEEIDRFLQSEADKQRKKIAQVDQTQANDESLYARSFSFSSRYQVWQETRQANGLLLMVGILLGAVFFAFAASILSFRLFGQLATARKYHASLNLLGVSRKMRHSIVTKELLLMYFIPGVIASSHFAVAFYGVTMIAGGILSIWPTYFTLLAAYFIFQTVFFFISRAHYLKRLDQRLDY